MKNNAFRRTAVLLCLACALIPALMAGAKSNEAKRKAISDSISSLLSSKHIAGNSMGVEIRDPLTGEVLYSWGSKRQLIPASNMKLVTSASAVSLLGPGFTFPTEVWVDGTLKDGVLDGNLYLKGFGDPSLVDENLWTLARDVAYRGIIEIKGKIIADDTFFDRNPYGEGWGKIGWEPYYAPMGALSLNFNTFVVTINPGEKVGAAPKVFYMPPDRHLDVVNRAVTVGGGRCRLKVIETDPEKNSFEVVGTIPVNGDTVEVRRSINDPSMYTVGSFEAYLISWGVAVSGDIDKGEVPKGAKMLLSKPSKPLSKIMWDSGKMSNNFVSEQVMKAICAFAGPKDKRVPASTTCGIETVEKFLTDIGVEEGSYVLADGSGLSRKNRLTPDMITLILQAMYRNQLLWPEFAASLSIAGVDGTLDDRFQKSPLKGKVRAKTGHLTGVNALSGFVPAKDGRLLAFSMLFNNFPGYHSTIERIQERVLEAATGY